MSRRRALALAALALGAAGLVAAPVLLGGCGARWTPQDRAGDIAAEALAEKLYAHNPVDGGDPVNRAYSQGILCAVGANLARHDAGRLVSTIVSCVQARTP